jgi:hypothetical protein
MCGDGQHEAGSPSSEEQHNKPTTGFRHVDVLRVSSSVGSWLASPSAPSCSPSGFSWAAWQILIKEVHRTHLKLFFGLLHFCTTMPPKAFTNSLPDSTKCLKVEKNAVSTIEIALSVHSTIFAYQQQQVIKWNTILWKSVKQKHIIYFNVKMQAMHCSHLYLWSSICTCLFLGFFPSTFS